MGYNFTVILDTKNFEISIDPEAAYGYFEHNDLGDECGGGLWFTGNDLYDYDGVFKLPAEVAQALRDHGYKGDILYD